RSRRPRRGSALRGQAPPRRRGARRTRWPLRTFTRTPTSRTATSDARRNDEESPPPSYVCCSVSANEKQQQVCMHYLLLATTLAGRGLELRGRCSNAHLRCCKLLFRGCGSS